MQDRGIMKIEIVDNFLSDYWADTYVKIFDGKQGKGGRNFPWFFSNDLNGVERMGNYYFNHQVILNYKVQSDQWLPIFEPLISTIGISFNNVWRLKVNLYPRTQRRVHHSTHIDYQPNSGLRTCLYYINTNNGVTIFDGKKTVKSIKNRIALFDGSIPHHSTTLTDVNYRCSINIDYKV